MSSKLGGLSCKSWVCTSFLSWGAKKYRHVADKQEVRGAGEREGRGRGGEGKGRGGGRGGEVGGERKSVGRRCG